MPFLPTEAVAPRPSPTPSATNKRLQPCRMTASTGALRANCADADPMHRGNMYDITYDFHVGNGTTGSDNGNVWGIANNKDSSRSQTFYLRRAESADLSPERRHRLHGQRAGREEEVLGQQLQLRCLGNLLQRTVTKCSAENLDYTYDGGGKLNLSGTIKKSRHGCISTFFVQSHQKAQPALRLVPLLPLARIQACHSQPYSP
jgi:hypothetical protein